MDPHCSAEIEKLHERIAQLESVNDQLTSELEYVDQLLRSVGFTDGLESVKAAAQELCDLEQTQGKKMDEELPEEPPEEEA